MPYDFSRRRCSLQASACAPSFLGIIYAEWFSNREATSKKARDRQRSELSTISSDFSRFYEGWND
jgi:hypothetical protein